MPSERRKLVLPTAALLLVTLACSTPSGGRGTKPARQAQSVRVSQFRFQPGTITVPAGGQVRWTNEDDIEHTVTSGEPGAKTGSFDNPFVKGEEFTFRFEQQGTFAYFCERHPVMRGEVVVT